MLVYKKITFVFVILFCSCSVFANKNYVNYHLRINNAECMINENQLQSALVIYQDVFRKYKNHFFKDINNAFYCCIGLKNYDKAKVFAEELVLHGYQLSDFEKNELVDFKKTEIWKEFKNEYPKLKKRYEGSINYDLKDKYDQIYIKDQKAANSDDELIMHETYYKQACLLSKLFAKNGFKSIGLNKDVQDYHIYAVLRHYCNLVNQLNAWPDLYTNKIYTKMKTDSIPLLQQFKNAIYEGKILPEHYASAIVYGDDSRKNEYGEILVLVNFSTKEKSLYSRASKEQLGLINERRLDIGLFPIKETSNSLIEGSWYKNYPFDSIIKILKQSKEKKLTGKLMMKMGNEESKVREQFKNKTSNFLLSGKANISGVCYSGYKEYLEE
jgi:hypothetical protein